VLVIVAEEVSVGLEVKLSDIVVDRLVEGVIIAVTEGLKPLESAAVGEEVKELDNEFLADGVENEEGDDVPLPVELTVAEDVGVVEKEREVESVPVNEAFAPNNRDANGDCVIVGVGDVVEVADEVELGVDDDVPDGVIVADEDTDANDE